MADDVYCDGPGLKSPRVLFFPRSDGVAIEVQDDGNPQLLVHVRLSRDMLVQLVALSWLEDHSTEPTGIVLEYPDTCETQRGTMKLNIPSCAPITDVSPPAAEK